MYDIVVVAVLEREDDLPDVVTADGLAVHETRGGPFHTFEAEVSTGHELEDHVEHALGAGTN